MPRQKGEGDVPDESPQVSLDAEFGAESVMRDRIALTSAVENLDLKIDIRDPKDFQQLDCSAFYGRSATRELIVSICADVSWGTEIVSYLRDADEFFPLALLMIDVPNTLEGRIEEVCGAVRAWFEHRNQS